MNSISAAQHLRQITGLVLTGTCPRGWMRYGSWPFKVLLLAPLGILRVPLEVLVGVAAAVVLRHRLR